MIKFHNYLIAKWTTILILNSAFGCSMTVFDGLLGTRAKNAAHRFLAASKKLVVEQPVDKPINYDLLSKSNGFSLSFPHIPSRGINPWLNATMHQSFRKKPLLHLRSRDFNSKKEATDFLKAYHIYPTLADILVVYGDGVKKSQHGVAPCELIPELKSIGFMVGGVFNPTPVIRNKSEELEQLLRKLDANPDFMVSQTTYNATAFAEFCESIPEAIKIFPCAGFWGKTNRFSRLGINNHDECGQEHYVPPERLIEKWLSDPRCAGIYICDYSQVN